MHNLSIWDSEWYRSWCIFDIKLCMRVLQRSEQLRDVILICICFFYGYMWYEMHIHSICSLQYYIVPSGKICFFFLYQVGYCVTEYVKSLKFWRYLRIVEELDLMFYKYSIFMIKPISSVHYFYWMKLYTCTNFYVGLNTVGLLLCIYNSYDVIIRLSVPGLSNHSWSYTQSCMYTWTSP